MPGLLQHLTVILASTLAPYSLLSMQELCKSNQIMTFLGSKPTYDLTEKNLDLAVAKVLHELILCVLSDLTADSFEEYWSCIL